MLTSAFQEPCVFETHPKKRSRLHFCCLCLHCCYRSPLAVGRRYVRRSGTLFAQPFLPQAQLLCHLSSSLSPATSKALPALAFLASACRNEAGSLEGSMLLFGLFQHSAVRCADGSHVGGTGRPWPGLGAAGLAVFAACGPRRGWTPRHLRHVSDQQSSDWIGRENSGMGAKRRKGGGTGMESESRGKEQGGLGLLGSHRKARSGDPPLTWRCTAAFTSRG